MKKIIVFVIVIFSCLLIFSSNNLKQTNITFPVKDAVNYCKTNNLQTKYCIFVNFNQESKEKRFVVYNLQEDKIEFSCKVAHGYGGNSTTKFADISNTIGSHCSSTGKFIILNKTISKKAGSCYRLKGVSKTNTNAFKRGILIHSFFLIDLYDYLNINIPLGPWSEGCFTISMQSFNKLQKYINGKPTLLWSYAG